MGIYRRSVSKSEMSIIMNEPRYQPPEYRSGRLQVVSSEQEQQAPGNRSIRREFLRLRDLIDRIEAMSLQHGDTRSQTAPDDDERNYSMMHQNGWHEPDTAEHPGQNDATAEQREDRVSEKREDSGSMHVPMNENVADEDVNSLRISGEPSDDGEHASGESAPATSVAESVPEHGIDEPINEIDYSVAVDLSPEIKPFDPFDPAGENEVDTHSLDNHQARSESEISEIAPRPDQFSLLEAIAVDDIQRRWVTFNGTLSLDRLALVRAELHHSPFVIEARFEEIGEGMVVLRLVTSSDLTRSQIEWVLGQLIESTGLEPKCATLSE
jgi:hypothetical protein